MLNKNNIMSIVADHEKKIAEIKEAIATVNNETAVRALKSELSYLGDNLARYQMQARAWGLL